LIQSLKKTTPENTRINPLLAARQEGRQIAVDSAEPARLTEHIKTTGVFEEQQGFRLAITSLLLQIIAHRVATKMPDHRSRTETDLVAFVLQTPAQIHVVPGSPKDGIKSRDRFESLMTKCHVAARNVLRDFVIEQDVGWRPGRNRNTRGDK